MTAPFLSTTAGVPRIGPDRELKKALEAYWRTESNANSANDGTNSDRADAATALNDTALQLTADYTKQAQEAGVAAVPTLGRSFYDSVLDASALLGVLPERVADIPDHGSSTNTDTTSANTASTALPAWIDRYFAAARGTAELPASAMTKWFDTNYHYIVPELSAQTTFHLQAESFVADAKAQVEQFGELTRPTLVGPFTYLKLSRTTDGSDPLDHFETLIDVYTALLTQLHTAGVRWVQLDEPSLVTDVDTVTLDRVRAGYQQLLAALSTNDATTTTPLNVVVQTYFGEGDQAIQTLSGLGIAAFGVDLVYGNADLPSWTGEELLLAGVVDGRNIWRTDLDYATATLKSLAQRGPVAVSTSCSLLHVPYALSAEPDLGDHEAVRAWLAFGAEKLAEVALLSRVALDDGELAADDEQALATSRQALADRESSTLTHNAAVRERIAAVSEGDRRREPIATRREAQRESLHLPPLPTTTIGSFPQTAEIRSARARLNRGELSAEEYRQAMVDEIEDVIARQEALGLDVLVHGEPERNDMVQYFSEQLDGYLATKNGWVQSYGSRCVRPPVIYGDVSRPQPMTVQWYQVAAGFTDKPVKGMLTGPVTMLAWSFVRDDQPLGETADQVALALRDEIADLIDAGARVVQVDEPAIRELLPLRSADQPAYIKWAVGAFRLATSGAPSEVQIHTHMCYSEFNELIATIGDLDADVTSIEAARNGMQVLSALNEHGYELGVGPGVWDIHSPRVPKQEEVDQLLADALQSVDPQLLWVNPDCGLKTRAWPETTASLQVLVEAARKARELATQ